MTWVQNARGSRNVWLASAPDFHARQLTSYTGDDGQDITTLVWSPDGTWVLYVRGRSDVDPRRIGVWGGSYGGFLTAQALARAGPLFAAGVDIHGVHDWNVGIRTFIPTYNPGPEIERRNFNLSPLAYVSGWTSPVLLIHGDDDRNVSFAETVTLAEALRQRGVTVEQLVLPDEIHGFLRHGSWLQVLTASADFFDRYVKAKRSGTN